MQTLYSILRAKCDGIKVTIMDFITRHTRINVIPESVRREQSASPIDRNMQNMPYFLPRDAFYHTVIINGSQCWAPLNEMGKQSQLKALKEFNQYKEVLLAIICDYPEETKTTFIESIQTVETIIQQNDSLGFTTIDEVAQAVACELNKQMMQIDITAKALNDWPILVVDTNALYHNPALEDWTFNDIPNFQLAVLPPVLEELDRHKTEDKNPHRQKKAERIIHQIKEYRRRGDIGKGVSLKSGISTFIAPLIKVRGYLASPFVNDVLADNQLLAGCFELARQNLDHPVTLVTRDVNLQNKAAYIYLPYLEPPDPVTTQP